MGHIDVSHVTFALPDGRVLLDDVSFRVGEGVKAALIGANGAGKTTLFKIIAGDLDGYEGSVIRTGGLAVMRQFIGHMTDGNLRDLMIAISPDLIRLAAAQLAEAELAMMQRDDEPAQMAYAQALVDWAQVGGYEIETMWDFCTMATLGIPFERAQWRETATLSGGEQKRLVLEALLRGPEEVLLLDEPDNYLDVPTKRWLEDAIIATKKSVLFISHDRELLARTAQTIITLELGAAGNSVWIHGGGWVSYEQTRRDRFLRFEELRRRWDEEHAKLRKLMLTMREKAKYNDGMAGRYQAAKSRLQRFEDVGPPQDIPREQNVQMRMVGGRTGKRAVVCEQLQLTNLTYPFDAQVWFGERVAILGANGSGKSHFLRLLAAGGTDPEAEHRPISDLTIAPVRHNGVAKLGARVRPGWFAQTHAHPEFIGRTLIEILGRGDEHRTGMDREAAGRVLGRYELSHSAEQTFETLSGGQQARFQILLLELAGATLLLLDEPTDNLDLQSAQALEDGLAAYEGAVLAVTHDRWFARGFDRFIVFGADGRVYESDEPVWETASVSTG
ncbi:MAG: ABC transporter ATP-binding protein [Actinobacteria bacterium]|nr:ABC transporter ATP-binding protein [Actinomycetota bacterium]